jgi:hypothetical protein
MAKILLWGCALFHVSQYCPFLAVGDAGVKVNTTKKGSTSAAPQLFFSVLFDWPGRVLFAQGYFDEALGGHDVNRQSAVP